MYLQIEIPQLTGLMRYGVPGLCAIAFILSYLLLFREGSRANPRNEMLKSIRMFMWITVVLGVASAYVAIKNPSKPEPEAHHAKPTRKVPKNAANSLTDSPATIRVEIFYLQDNKNIFKGMASSLADGLDNGYEVMTTPITEQRRKSLKVQHNQIRHESTEKNVATRLQQANKILKDDDVNFSLKQISSSSPQYLSVFICE